MFNGFCGFVFERIRSFEVVKIAVQSKLSKSLKHYAHRMCGSGFTQMFRPWTAHGSTFTGVSPSWTSAITSSLYGLKIIPKSVISLIDALFVFLRGYCTPTRKLACFVCFLLHREENQYFLCMVVIDVCDSKSKSMIFFSMDLRISHVERFKIFFSFST